ncbi:MAG: hypothetical protein JNM56_39865 [Planctomycetia bacterium]|nr:hypothetical protein [Planctomycetia bacterium]
MKSLCLPALATVALGWAASVGSAQYIYPTYPGQPVAPGYYQQPMQSMPMGQMQPMPMQQMPMGQMPVQPVSLGQMQGAPLMQGAPMMPAAMTQPVVVPVYVPVVQQRIPMFGPVDTLPEGGPLASPPAAPVSTAATTKTVSETTVSSSAAPWYQKVKKFLIGD